MADDTKPITSSGPKPPQTIGTVAPMENKRDDSGDQAVRVVALRTFHRDGDMKGEMTQPGDEFDVPRHRAAQLRANGLISYASESDDHAIHGEAEAKRIGERVQHREEASAIPPNSRGKPLVNPEIKMADVPADQTGKRK